MQFIQYGNPVAFVKDEYGTKFVKDFRACNTLNKILDTKYKAVYREEQCYKDCQWSYPEANINYESAFYVLRSDDKVIKMWVSEWAGIEVIS